MKPSKQLNSLVEVFRKIKSDQQMLDFLLGILTQAEIEEIGTRIEIVKMLKAGVGQHKIAKELNVGVGTVTRGSKEIQKGRFNII